MVHRRKKCVRSYSDREIYRWLISELPPVNLVVLNKAKTETKDPLLKKGLNEWIDVVKGKKAFMDTDVFDKISMTAKRKRIEPEKYV